MLKSDQSDVTAWMNRANQDFELAQRGETDLSASATYLYSQAAEKALKALYLYLNKSLAPKTQDLSGLLNLVSNLERPSKEHDAADNLNHWNVDGRYPTQAYLSVTESEALEAREYASVLLEFVKSKLQE
jgi:HEPN domain-containing protein